MLLIKLSLVQSIWSFHMSLFGEKPNINHFIIFGSPYYVHILDLKRSKLDTNAEKFIFIGYHFMTYIINLFFKKFNIIFLFCLDFFSFYLIWSWTNSTLLLLFEKWLHLHVISHILHGWRRCRWWSCVKR